MWTMNRGKTQVLLGGLAIAVATVGAFLVSGCGRGASGLRIGVLFPMTGEAGSYGEKGRDAVLLAVDEVNASGGVHGQPVRAFFEDSKADPATGMSAARKLISADRVNAIEGDIVSAVTLAVAPIAESNHVVLLSPTSSAPAIADAGEYVYRIWPSDLEEGRAIATYAATAGYRRAGVLYMNNDYGQAIAGIFKSRFHELGGGVVSLEGYQGSDSDFRPFLAKLRSSRADVLYIAGYFADTATIVRQAREVGITVPLLGTTAIEDPQFLNLAGPAAEGIVYPLATGFDPSTGDPVGSAFVKAFRSRYRREPGWVEAHSYDAFKLLCYVAERSQIPLTGEELRRGLDNMGAYQGVTGSIRFDRNGDVVKPVVLKVVRGGRFARLR